jgi:Flp pilus assembly protein TadB
VIWRILAVVSFGWFLVNAYGLAWAALNGEGMHSLVHAVLTVALAAAAVFLWRMAPRSKARAQRQALPDAQVEQLNEEINSLQRQLDETRESLTFAEQLLAKRKADGPRSTE